MKYFILMIVIVMSFTIQGQSITASGGPWVVSIAYPFDAVLSPNPQVQISIKPSSMDWLVTVHRDAINWQPDLQVSIRRTGDGAGNAESLPQGGLSWIEITETPQDFFWGGPKNRNNVPCQYLLEPDWPAEGTYSTTVTFTLITR